MAVTPSRGSRVAVLGLGLIGGSVARKLHASGYQVTGFDVDPATRTAAAAVGIGIQPTIKDLCTGSPDVLMLAVPLTIMAEVIGDVARNMAPGTVLTDVGSVKAPVRAIVAASGLGTRYVGAHPMAGTEHSGFDASSAELLDGARWAVTIAPDTEADRLLAILDLVTITFGGTAYPLTDGAHDDATALVSHVPHILATELFNLVTDTPLRGTAWGLAAGSFRDGTRVARTDPRRTEAMVTNNAVRVARALRTIIRDLDGVATALESNAPPTAFFDHAAGLRALATPGAPNNPDDEQVRVVLDEPSWRTTLTSLGESGAYITGASLSERAVTLSRGAKTR